MKAAIDTLLKQQDEIKKEQKLVTKSIIKYQDQIAKDQEYLNTLVKKQYEIENALQKLGSE